MKKQMTFEQTTMLDASSDMREVSGGYLVAKPRIARTGIQLYRGDEVGRPDLKEVRVYRPESEVMSKDAMRSLAWKPVTVEHPDDPVTAKNWRDLAVGHLSDEVVRDGEFIRVPLMLMDAKAIDIVRGGKRQLSVGYSAVLDWTDGKTKDGEAYDAVQTSIRANHVAITHTARGGDKLRMGDNKERNMAKLTVDGIVVEMEERDQQLIERHIANLVKEVAGVKTEVAAAKTELANVTAAAQTKDAEITTLKQQLVDAKMTPQKLDQMVSERAKTVERAKALIGDTLVIDGKTDADMRKQVVLAKLGDVAKDWNDDMVTASFNTLTVTGDSGGDNGLRRVSEVLRNNSGSDDRNKAYDDYDKQLSERWKTAGGRA